MNDGQLLALIGLGSGMLLGMSARLGRFCSLGAIKDIVYGKKYSQALTWSAAIGWAMLFLAIAIWLGYFRFEAALYLQFKPNYVAHILGGLTFGYGMALAGMCGFTGLARLGAGDMRSLLVVLIIGVSSWATAIGPLAKFRQSYFNFEAAGSNELPSFAHYLSAGSGVPIAGIFWIIGLFFVVLPMLNHSFRRSTSPIWGMLVGAGVSAAWVGTFSAAFNNFSSISVESHNFSLPLGDTIIYLMASSSTGFNFGVGSVTGVVLGGTLGSLILNDFKWNASKSNRELRRIIFGAILMGIGSVVAFGCSIGQGLSAMSLLYFGAPVTLAAIVIGAYIGLKYLIEG